MLPDGADTLDVGPSGRRAGVFRQLVQQIVNELLEEAVITAHHEVTYNSAQCNKACVIEVVTSIKISHNFMSNGLQVSWYNNRREHTDEDRQNSSKIRILSTCNTDRQKWIRMVRTDGNDGSLPNSQSGAGQLW